MKHKNLGETYPIRCRFCDNTVYYHLIKQRKWTFFLFITLPIKLPTDSPKWFLLCPVCKSAGINLQVYDNKTVKAAKKLSNITEKYIEGELSNKKYNKKIQKFTKYIQKQDKQKRQKQQ